MQGVQQIISALLLPVAFIAIMYFMIFMPQKKKDKARKDMQDSIKDGDEVVTIGGIIGKVVNVKDDEITIETGVAKTQLKLLRFAIDSITTPEKK
ncbi:preprotein translocase subunit YajC [Acetivibrio cellulolyticus]|uniref:preprotein translocase subunit YajC n=1 Tax=Acetivibrio cellulolyticus TaxID=35830 RepID=UPI0001E30547|nr:preprotein translocase subunit YajC [Acetivibrio cellulolyticus]